MPTANFLPLRMAKTRAQKELTVKQLVEKLSTMKALVFISFAGLTVKEATLLRQTLREQQVDFLIAQKSLLRRALGQADLDPEIVDRVAGSAALAFGYGDEVMPARLLQKFGKDHPAVQLVGGVVQGAWLGAPEVQALAKLPNREELIAKTVWTIQAPLTGLVNVMAGNLRGLLNVLNALQAKQPATS